MQLIQEIFSTENWEEASLDYISDSLKEKKDDFNIKMWKNTDKSISPFGMSSFVGTLLSE